MKRTLVTGLAAATLWGATSAMAYEKSYTKTPVDTVELKTIPPVTALRASSEKNYFSKDNQLFMRLFRYIDDNEISMTVPVEAEIEPGAMRFFVGPKDLGKATKNTKEVTVLKMPERKVLSIGLRGRYTEERFDQGVSKLNTWLAQHPEWTAGGSPYAVYWNSPFVPGWFKRSEVHVPVKSSGNTATE